MADLVARPRVEFNGKQVESQLKKLTEEAKRLDKAIDEAVKVKDVNLEKKLKRQLNAVNRETKNLKQETIKVDNVLRDLNGTDFNTLRKAFSKQQRLVKGLRKDAKNYNAEISKLKTLKGAMSSFNGGLQKQQGMLKRVTGSFNNYFGIVTAGLASLTGVAMSARKAVDMANTREDIKGNVKALTGLAGEEIDFLEQKAIGYSTTVDASGVRIQKSADEILQAFQLVGSAQPALLADKEALADVTKEMLILAEAGENGIELKDAIDATTKAMNQYGATAEQTSRFTNAMAAGAQKGAVPINEIGSAIKEFGKSASKAGVPIEQSVALLETIGEKAGIVGPRAGIQMRNFFAVLASGPAETNPEIVGLDTALENLGNKSMSSAEYVKMFGRENALVAETIITNTDYLGNMTDALTNTDTAYEQARANTQDNKAALEQAKNKAREYAIELGKKLQPALRHMVSTGSLVIKGLTATIDLFAKHGKAIAVVTAAIVTYTAIIKAKAIAEKVSTTATKIATAATKLFNAALKANPIGLIVGLLVAAGTALWVYRDKLFGVSKTQKALNEIAEETNKQFAKESASIDILFGKLKKTNKGTKERKELIAQINKEYGKYLPKLLDENASLSDIEKAYKAVNEAIKEKIRLKVIEKKAEQLAEEKFNLEEKLKKVIKRSNSMWVKNNIELKAINKLRQKNIRKDIKETEEAYNKMIELLAKPIVTPKTEKKEEKKEEKEEVEVDVKVNTGNAKQKAEDLRRALYELRKKFGLLDQQELYEEEIRQLDEHKARKLLKDEEYLQARHQIFLKYFGATPISAEDEQQDIDEFVQEETADPFSLDSKRAMAEDDYQREMYKNTLDWKYEQLEAEWERGEIGWSEYHDRLNELDEQRKMESMRKVSEGFEHTAKLADAVSKIILANDKKQKNKELAEAEAKYKKDMKAAGNNTKLKEKIEADYQKKKEEIEKGYRKKEYQMALRMAYVNSALSILKAVGSAPFPANIPAIAFATAAGIANIATITANGFEQGGYTGFDGSNKDLAGVVHKNEFVANAQATNNPSVRPVLDIINLAQKDGSIATLDLPSAIQSLTVSKSLQQGGYATISTNNQKNTSDTLADDEPTNNNEILQAAEIMLQAAEIFANKKITIGPEAIEKVTQVQEEIKVLRTSGTLK